MSRSGDFKLPKPGYTLRDKDPKFGHVFSVEIDHLVRLLRSNYLGDILSGLRKWNNLSTVAVDMSQFFYS